MSNLQTTFERFEYKYWVSERLAEEFLRLVAPHLRLDGWAPEGQHNTSLYLDSQDLCFLQMHTESAPDRFKLRVRAYGQPPQGPAFFEIKRKVKAVIFKRRAIVPMEAVPALLCGERVEGLRLKTAGEEDTLEQFLYLMMAYRAEPKVLITCRRQAFVSADSADGLRITIDRGIAYQVARERTLNGASRNWIPLCGMWSYQPGATTLIEVKFPGIVPLWLAEAVQRLGLSPSSYSKYVAAMSLENLGPAGMLSSDLIPSPSLQAQRGV